MANFLSLELRPVMAPIYRFYLQVIVVCAVLLWAVPLFTAPPGDITALSNAGVATTTSSSTHLLLADTQARQELLELQRTIDQLLTKQQDIQGQLDILRQQIPLPEEVDGTDLPPKIGYTKWAKNYYNTRRDRPQEGDYDHEEKDYHSTGDALAGRPEVRAHSTFDDQQPEVVAKGRLLDRSVGGTESSEGNKCVLPHRLDYARDFWMGQRRLGGCCLAGGDCSRKHELHDGRYLESKCSSPASVVWGAAPEQNTELVPGQRLDIAKIIYGSGIDHLNFSCEGVTEPVVVPATNELAYQRARSLNSTSKYNVVVLMIDALSSAHFIRALPKTTNYLRELAEQVGGKFSAFDFQFFGTLGAYSPPNRHAFFSGFPLPDDQAFYEGSLFPPEEKIVREEERKGVWMWDMLSAQGYVTYSARDMCSRSASFVYADFISRPWTDVHFQDFYCSQGYRGHAMARVHCVLGNYAHYYPLESGYLFHSKHADVPRFTYLDFAEGHEPSMMIVRTMDEDLMKYLPLFLSDEKTVVVLASDHGIGYGSQHTTLTGPLEERLPALFLIAPNGMLSTEIRHNLQSNTQKLVTGVDVFETVMDVAGAAGARPWAYSLLRPMPSRNCKEAGINIHSCPCSLWDGDRASRIATWPPGQPNQPPLHAPQRLGDGKRNVGGPH